MPVPSGGVPPDSLNDLGSWVRVSHEATFATTIMMRATWVQYWASRGWVLVESLP